MEEGRLAGVPFAVLRLLWLVCLVPEATRCRGRALRRSSVLR